MFGDSVARTIKQYNGTKIILISAYDLDSSLVKELEENKYIVKYIEKPIQISDLMKLVADTKSQIEVSLATIMIDNSQNSLLIIVHLHGQTVTTLKTRTNHFSDSKNIWKAALQVYILTQHTIKK